MTVNIAKLISRALPSGMEFHFAKVGHVVPQITDQARAVEFCTQVLGFKVSDVYFEERMPSCTVLLRCHNDRHCPALVSAGNGQNRNRELHYLAFEVPTLGEVLRARDRSRQLNAKIDLEGRRRAGCQVAVEFRDPETHSLEIHRGVDPGDSDGRVRPAKEWHGVTSLDEAIANPLPGQDTCLPR